MEYKPTRYGNALNAKAVQSAESLYPEIFFQDGETALEMLDLRYIILRSKVPLDNMELASKEFYSAHCEMELVKARGSYDKAASALV